MLRLLRKKLWKLVMGMLWSLTRCLEAWLVQLHSNLLVKYWRLPLYVELCFTSSGCEGQHDNIAVAIISIQSSCQRSVQSVASSIPLCTICRGVQKSIHFCRHTLEPAAALSFQRPLPNGQTSTHVLCALSHLQCEALPTAARSISATHNDVWPSCTTISVESLA